MASEKICFISSSSNSSTSEIAVREVEGISIEISTVKPPHACAPVRLAKLKVVQRAVAAMHSSVNLPQASKSLPQAWHQSHTWSGSTRLMPRSTSDTCPWTALDGPPARPESAQLDDRVTPQTSRRRAAASRGFELCTRARLRNLSVGRQSRRPTDVRTSARLPEASRPSFRGGPSSDRRAVPTSFAH